MKYSNIKRWIERNQIGEMIKLIGVEELEKTAIGFWDIVAEYFTAE